MVNSQNKFVLKCSRSSIKHDNILYLCQYVVNQYLKMVFRKLFKYAPGFLKGIQNIFNIFNTNMTDKFVLISEMEKCLNAQMTMNNL